MNREQRNEELTALPWQKLKALCEDHGIEKQDSEQWSDKISALLDREESLGNFSDDDEDTVVFSKSEPTAVEVPEGDFPNSDDTSMPPAPPKRQRTPAAPASSGAIATFATPPAPAIDNPEQTTATYQAIGALVCAECGQPKQTGLDGSPKCADGKPTCAFLEEAAKAHPGSTATLPHPYDPRMPNGQPTPDPTDPRNAVPYPNSLAPAPIPPAAVSPSVYPVNPYRPVNSNYTTP